MVQYDLFTGKESALTVSENLTIPPISSPSDLEYFLNQLNVVQVGVHFLGSAVQKRPVSGNYRGLCPFHAEKTPSFYLKPKPNYFTCYGCQEAGGPLMLWARLDGSLLDNLIQRLIGEDVDVFDRNEEEVNISAEQRQYYLIFGEALDKEYKRY